jgi:catechol 2,3-dioxygenase
MSVSHPTPTSSSGALLADATRVGAVHLTVTDLDRSLAFYEGALGLRVQRRDEDVGSAALGAGAEDLLVLHEDAHARPAGRHAGLYHVALLYGSRQELARVTQRLVATGTPIQGASDHGTHEAIYLPDPDGNGLELAADRPRSAWPTLERAYAGGPAPLDLRGLLDLVAGAAVVPHAEPSLTVGHVHLHVADIAAATRFYRDGLGFAVVFAMPTAVFVSAGGYHHHVGFNVWQGEGVPPAPADAVGLRFWTLHVAGAGEVAAVRERLAALGAPAHEQPGGGLLARDPSGTAVLVVADPDAAA